MRRTASSSRGFILLVAALAIPLGASQALAELSAPDNMWTTSTASTITVSWTPVLDNGARGYYVYYDTDGPEPPFDGIGAEEGDSPIRVFGAASDSLTLNGLAANSRYYFVVAAFDQGDAPGQPSRAAQGALCDVLNPAAPTGLAASLQSDGVHLVWNPNTEVDAWGVTVFRGLSPAPTDSVAFVALPGATLLDTNVQVNRTYYYCLRAIDFCNLKSRCTEDVTIFIPPPPPQFTRSDVDASGEVNISDPIYNLAWQFQGGPQPPCIGAADDDDSGDINVSDPIYSLNYQFSQGPQPPAPFPSCGPDPTVDTLSCLNFPPCGTEPPPVAPPRPTNGAEVLELVDGAVNGDSVSYSVVLKTGTPLFGIEGEMTYPSDRLDFVRVSRTDYTGSWSFLSAKADPMMGTIYLGGLVDYNLQQSVTPDGQVAAHMVFHVKSDPGTNAIHLAAGRFVSSAREAIRPVLQEANSGVPAPGDRASDGFRPVLVARNPFRIGSDIQLVGAGAQQAAEVSLFSVTGERVRVLFRGKLNGTSTSMVWDGRDQAGRQVEPGSYFLLARVGSYRVTTRIVLLP